MKDLIEEAEVDKLIYNVFNKNCNTKKRISGNDLNVIYNIEMDFQNYILKIYKCDIPIVKNCVGCMKYVHEKTSIPVPKIISYGENYILMEKADGIILEDVWEKFTYEEKLKIIDQYVDIIKALNNLKFQKICGIDANYNIIPSLFHYRWNPRFYVDFNHGPFDNIKDFMIAEINKYIKFIEKITSLEKAKILIPKLNLLIKKIQDEIIKFSDVDICMTHNDLGPHNILVNSNGIIKSIIDWDFAGFNLSYLEWKISIQDAFFRFPIDEDLKIQNYVINLVEKNIPNIKHNMIIDDVLDCFRTFICMNPTDNILNNGINNLNNVLKKYNIN